MRSVERKNVRVCLCADVVGGNAFADRDKLQNFVSIREEL